MATMELTAVELDGKRIERGDYVGFKSDIEQSGKVIDIWEDSYMGTRLRLYREHGFEGGYIGGDTTTDVSLKDCWVD